MAKILFLAHRTPFPPDKGDKIRALHMLKHLASRHEVWLGAGVDDQADLAHLPAARALCRDVCFAPLGPLRRYANMAAGLMDGRPLSVARFAHPRLARWVRQVLREVEPDLIVVFSSAPAQFVLGATPGTPLIVDFVDADAAKWLDYAQIATRPARWLYAMEARRLARFDAAALGAATAGVLISETERRLFASFQPQGASKLQVMPNGVDTDYFHPSPTPPIGAGEIVLCGRMDYLPNIDAAVWFAREVFPLVRAQAPDAAFRVVGAAPTPAVRALGQIPGIGVTGAVPDVRPYLAQAGVVVAPLRIARGIQNKVLEGMACARAVVATPQALDGIEAMPGRDLLVAQEPAEFAAAVVSVLRGEAPAGLGAAARDFVMRRHQWSVQLEQLDRLIELAGLSQSTQAAA
jgi:sugar transferase (PEP-CTERM/EpsH1 system associated)